MKRGDGAGGKKIEGGSVERRYQQRHLGEAHVALPMFWRISGRRLFRSLEGFRRVKKHGPGYRKRESMSAIKLGYFLSFRVGTKIEKDERDVSSQCR